MSSSAPPLPITESVRWAYRFVLGREPENENVIGHWASLGDGRAVLAHFVQSPEGIARCDAGFPTWGDWSHAPLDATIVAAAHLLRFNTMPTTDEIAQALTLHGTIASFRDAFLNSAEVMAMSEIVLPPAATSTPPTLTPTPTPTPQEHGFAILGQSFTLRGEGQEEYWRGLVEGPPDPSVERLARLIRAAFPDGGAGRVLVDAGANIGLTSLAMAAAAPYHAELLCFEPDERSIPLLRHNLAANRLERAQVLQMALAERDGTARLRRGASNTATSSLLEPYGRAQETGAILVDVAVRRLDGVLTELGLDRLDFLKIDVEGAETTVMLGAAEAITRDRPIIFAEFNLWTQMTTGGRNPIEVLEEWRAAFNHMVVFDHQGRPLPIRDHDGLLWILHTVMTERGCVDDLILCDRLDWMERWT